VKEEALSLVESIDDPVRKKNVLREYVQAFVLRSLHESEAFRGMAFVGGTALRFLEGLPRYSEDLDFSLVNALRYEPFRWLKKIKSDLSLAGFECAVTFNERKTVNAAWVRIAGLLSQAGLAASSDPKLAVKLEIDTRPPAGAVVARTVLRRHLTFVVRHYDRSSLMAGKLHALWTRPYPKGRDWFDLVWYLAHKPPVAPNLELLQNALDQTRGRAKCAAGEWREHLKVELAQLDAAALVRDVRAFLERPEDRELLIKENLFAALDDASWR
jgi:hypothetical protein